MILHGEKTDKTPAFEVCGCCGVDFGYQDCTSEYVKKFREEWMKKGGKCSNLDEKPGELVIGKTEGIYVK